MVPSRAAEFENICVDERYGSWYLRGEKLLFQAVPGAVLLHYQLEMPLPSASAVLLFPRPLSAYSPPLLAYELSGCKNALPESGKGACLDDYLRLFTSYCELRLNLADTLLDYRRIVLHPELIFSSHSSAAGRGAAPDTEQPSRLTPLFLYLPLAEEEEEGREAELEEEHAAALSLLIERAVVLGQSELRLDGRRAADWIHSGYSDFENFQHICQRLSDEQKSAPAFTIFKGIRKKEGAKPGQKTAALASFHLGKKLKGEPLLLASSLAALILANLLLMLPEGFDFPWRLELSFLSFVIAGTGLVLALLHPESAYTLRRTRYQARQSELLRELNLGETASDSDQFMQPHPKRHLDRHLPFIYPAYLYTLPSAQGKRLRSLPELALVRAEACLFGQSLTLGSNPAQAELALGFEGEPGLYCKLWSDREGAWCALLETSLDFKVNGQAVEPNQATPIPDHCLLEIGPCLREFYRENSP